jgi:hypothetical protein
MIIGLVIDLISDSDSRDELFKMVNENKIKEGNKLIDFVDYKKIKMDTFEQSATIQGQKLIIETLKTDLENVRDRSKDEIKAYVGGIISTTENGMAMVRDQIPNAIKSSMEQLNSVIINSGLTIKNNDSEIKDSDSKDSDSKDSDSKNKNPLLELVMKGGKRKSKNHRKRRKQKSTRKLY